jgi:hypothetical protein
MSLCSLLPKNKNLIEWRESKRRRKLEWISSFCESCPQTVHGLDKECLLSGEQGTRDSLLLRHFKYSPLSHIVFYVFWELPSLGIPLSLLLVLISYVDVYMPDGFCKLYDAI